MNRSPTTTTTSDLQADTNILAQPGGLLDQLHDLIAEISTDPTKGTRTSHKAQPAPPWHAEAASVYTGIHAGARDLERDLRYRVTGAWRDRGGSHENTRKALEAIPSLAEAVPTDAATEAERLVARWVTAAQQIRDIDSTDRWDPVPRPRGGLPPACPYCGDYSLRMCRERGQVRCWNPSCTDMDGRRPVGQMAHGAVSGEGMLVFGDSTAVHYRDEPEETGP